MAPGKKKSVAKKLDLKGVRLQKTRSGSGNMRKTRKPSAVFKACEYQKGDKKGALTGRAYLQLGFDASLNPAFHKAKEAVTFLGDVRFRKEDNNSWHVGWSCPKMYEAWMDALPADDAFKAAFKGITVEATEDYVEPEVDIVKLDDGRVMLNVTPVNGLYHHRGLLSGDDGIFSYTRNIAGVPGLNRQLSASAVDTADVIDLLNDAGFALSDANVKESSMAELAKLATVDAANAEGDSED